MLNAGKLYTPFDEPYTIGPMSCVDKSVSLPVAEKALLLPAHTLYNYMKN
jgi:hypothetical protein